MDAKTKEIITNLLVSATEGGSNYWYYVPKVEANALEVQTKTEFFQEIPVKTSGAIWFTDSDNVVDDGESFGEPIIYPGSGTLKRVDFEALKEGWEIFRLKYPKHYVDAIAQDDDATTGDVFLQCVVFGEVIYG